MLTQLGIARAKTIREKKIKHLQNCKRHKNKVYVEVNLIVNKLESWEKEKGKWPSRIRIERKLCALLCRLLISEEKRIKKAGVVLDKEVRKNLEAWDFQWFQACMNAWINWDPSQMQWNKATEMNHVVLPWDISSLIIVPEMLSFVFV